LIPLNGEIETIKVGHMTLIPMDSLLAFLSSHRERQSDG